MYFSVGRWRPTAKRPLIPGRVGVFIRLWQYRNRIFSLGVHQVFTQSPETMIAISGLRWRSICYCFAGAESPLHRPRYPWARGLAPVFERWWWKALGRADVLLASADQSSIDEFVRTRRIAWLRPRIVPFPTRYDESVFYPVEQSSARSAVQVPVGPDSGGVCGSHQRGQGVEPRLGGVQDVPERHPDTMLCFVGDGEDRPSHAPQGRRDRHIRIRYGDGISPATDCGGLSQRGGFGCFWIPS